MKNLTVMTDEELVILYLEGDTTAFGVLWIRYESEVTACIQAKVHDLDLAKDLTQETSIKVFLNMRKGFYAERSVFRSWAKSIAINLVYDYFRDRKRLVVLSENEVEIDFFNGPDFAVDCIEDWLIKEQRPVDLEKLLKHLPGEQSEVIRLYYYEDFSVKQISEILLLNLNTVLGRMRYGKKNMLRLIHDNEISLR